MRFRASRAWSSGVSVVRVSNAWTESTNACGGESHVMRRARSAAAGWPNGAAGSIPAIAGCWSATAISLLTRAIAFLSDLRLVASRSRLIRSTSAWPSAAGPQAARARNSVSDREARFVHGAPSAGKPSRSRT